MSFILNGTGDNTYSAMICLVGVSINTPSIKKKKNVCVSCINDMVNLVGLGTDNVTCRENILFEIDAYMTRTAFTTPKM